MEKFIYGLRSYIPKYVIMGNHLAIPPKLSILPILHSLIHTLGLGVLSLMVRPNPLSNDFSNWYFTALCPFSIRP